MTKDEQIKQLQAEIKELSTANSEATITQREIMRALKAEESAHLQTQANYRKVLAASHSLFSAVANTQLMLRTSGINTSHKVLAELSDGFRGPR